MAWDETSKKVAIKAIGTVESSMRYDSINYNDPITVGIAQWYGPRAADILKKMGAAHATEFAGVASSLKADLSSTERLVVDKQVVVQGRGRLASPSAEGRRQGAGLPVDRRP